MNEEYFIVLCTSIKPDFESEDYEKEFYERTSIYLENKNLFFSKTVEGTIKEWFSETTFIDYGDVYYCEQLGLYINKDSLKMISLKDFIAGINETNIKNTRLDEYVKRYFEIAEELYKKDENYRDQLHLNLVMSNQTYVK